MVLKLATIILMLTNSHGKGTVINVENYEIKKVKGIERRVTDIDFDVKGNTYVRGDSTHLYVLDPKNEDLLYSKHEHFAKVIATTTNFTYIILSASPRPRTEKHHTLHGIHRMRSDKMELQQDHATYVHLKAKKYHDAFCIDSDNILYFNGGLENGWGLKLLKPDWKDYSTVQTKVKPFYFYACEEDENGNLYFINNELKKGSITYLTKQERLVDSPKAKHNDFPILDFKIWNNNKVYVEVSENGFYSVSILGRDLILPESKGKKYYFFNKKFSQRFYIIEDRNDGRESYIHYITKKNLTTVMIPKPMVPSIVKYSKRPMYVEDKQGTAYFPHRGSDGYQRLLVLKIKETEWEEIVLWERSNICDLVVDNENNIWLLFEDGLYTLDLKNPKHDVVEIKTKAIDWEPDCESFLKVKKTNVYIGTKNGVFILSKKQTQKTTPSTSNTTDN